MVRYAWANVGVVPYFDCSWSASHGFSTRIFPAANTWPSALSTWFEGTVGARFRWVRGDLDLEPPTRLIVRVEASVRAIVPTGYPVELRNGLGSPLLWDAGNENWYSAGRKTLLLDVPVGAEPVVTTPSVLLHANSVGHADVGGSIPWAHVRHLSPSLPLIAADSEPSYRRGPDGQRVLNVRDSNNELVMDRALHGDGHGFRGFANLTMVQSVWDHDDTRYSWHLPGFPESDRLTAQTIFSLSQDSRYLSVEFVVQEEPESQAFGQTMRVLASCTSRTEPSAPLIPANLYIRCHFPTENWFEWQSHIDAGHAWAVSCSQSAYFGGVVQASWSEDNAYWFVLDQRARPALRTAAEILSSIPKFRLLGRAAGFLLTIPWTKSYTQGVAFTMDLFNSPHSVKEDARGNPVASSHRPEEFRMRPGLWMDFRHHYFEGEQYDFHGYLGQIKRQPAVKVSQQWYGIFTLIYEPPTPHWVVLEEM